MPTSRPTWQVCAGARIAGTAATTGTSSATQTGNGGGTSYQREKCEMPPPTNGAFVETITFEPLGRPGKEGLQVVEAMAADAATMRGDRTAAPAAGRRVRHALEYTLITGVGENPEKGTQWATRMSNSRDERRRATTDCLQPSACAICWGSDAAGEHPAVGEVFPCFFSGAFKRPVSDFQCAL